MEVILNIPKEKTNNKYDVIIIGGGPGGLSAGVYAGRSSLKTLLLEKEVLGGQIAITDFIEDYPGFPDGLTAQEFIKRFENHAKNFGTDIRMEEVKKIEIDGKWKIVKASEGVYRSKTVIVATGATHRKLGVPGEKEFTGKGVSYCAVCDGPFFKNQDIVVVGGGDSAVTEGIYLTKFGKKVFIVHRRDKFRAAETFVKRARENERIEFIMDTVVTEIYGTQKVEGLVLKNVKTEETRKFPCSAVFIFIGLIPNSGILKGFAKFDAQGAVFTNEKMEVEVPGIYAIGDLRNTSLRQAVTAASDGAIAAIMASNYIEENF